MTRILVLSTAAMLALSGAAIAKGHNNSGMANTTGTDSRSESATNALTTEPAGLPGSQGFDNAVAKGTNAQ